MILGPGSGVSRPAGPVVAAASRAADRDVADQCALAFVLAMGVALRAVLYFSRPSLLLDEVRLSLNIAARSWSGLLRPLDYDQTAPPLFLWAEKAATALGGVNEYSLRAIPFLASVALLPLVYALARRTLSERGSLLAVAIAGFSPLFLQYTRQVKPYGVDAVVALCLTVWALDWAAAPEDRGQARRLLLAGVVAVWLSSSALFVLVGIGVGFALALPTARSRSGTLLPIVGAWLVSFTAAYWWIYRPIAGNPYMQQFWSGSLVAAWKPAAAWRLWHAVREIVWQTFVGGTTEPPLGPLDDLLVNVGTMAFLFLGGVGLRRLAREKGLVSCALVVTPGLAALGASLAGQYPLAARLMLFAVPALIVLVAAGSLGVVGGVQREPRDLLAALAGAFLLAPALPLDFWLVSHPTAYEHIRPAVREFERRSAPGDAIYVFAASVPAWTFYTTDWSAPDTSRLARMARLASSGGPAFENAAPREQAMRSEGDSLAYPFQGRREVIGLYHGAQNRQGTGLVQHSPDTNWTTNEARRIRNAATPTVWVLMSHTYGLERFLLGALDLCLERVSREDGVVLARFAHRPRDSSGCSRGTIFFDGADPGPR